MNNKILEKRMQELGIYSEFYLRKELKSLASLLHDGEILNSIITGVNDANRCMVAVTDRCIYIIQAGALGSGNYTVIKPSAVKDYSFNKKLLFSWASITTGEKEYIFKNTQGSMKELFEYAMKILTDK